MRTVREVPADLSVKALRLPDGRYVIDAEFEVAGVCAFRLCVPAQAARGFAHSFTMAADACDKAFAAEPCPFTSSDAPQ